MPCFDLSGFGPLPEGTKIQYQTAWGIYEKVRTNDISVSTMRGNGDTSKFYFQFQTSEERNQWVNGLLLHIKRYPTSNWFLPEKN